MSLKFATFFTKNLTDSRELSGMNAWNEDLPRTCILRRLSPYDNYGFQFKTLKNEDIHVIQNVQPGMIADRAGIRNGDYILEVNGEKLIRMDHDAVARKMIFDPTQFAMTVFNYQSYLDLLNKYKDLAPLRPDGTFRRYGLYLVFLFISN